MKTYWFIWFGIGLGNNTEGNTVIETNGDCLAIKNLGKLLSEKNNGAPIIIRNFIQVPEATYLEYNSK